MSFNVTFNKETKTYDKPITVLEVVGNDKDIICAYVNRRVRELTYVLDKDSEVVPLRNPFLLPHFSFYLHANLNAKYA